MEAIDTATRTGAVTELGSYPGSNLPRSTPLTRLAPQVCYHARRAAT